MFGLFNRMMAVNTDTTTDRAILYLDGLPTKTRNDIADNMITILNAYLTGGGDRHEFFSSMSALKRACRQRNNLKNSNHPEFEFLQLLEDSAFASESSLNKSTPGYSWARTREWILRNMPIDGQAEARIVFAILLDWESA